MTPDERATLTTTSFAILGHLARRPWTMYELARHMRVEFSSFFPRAESQIYAEPKRLVRLGLAAARTESTGRRRRTVYAISSDGLQELSMWLAQPPQRPLQLEFEGLLRVALSPCGQPADLRRTLGVLETEAAAALESSGMRTERLRAFGDDVPQEAAALLAKAMVQDYLAGLAAMTGAWARRSLARLDRWAALPEPERMASVLAHPGAEPAPGVGRPPVAGDSG